VSYTLSPYILLLSMSFTLCFNIGLDGFSVTVLSEKNDKLGLRSEDGQMSSSESQFRHFSFSIDRQRPWAPPLMYVEPCRAVSQHCDCLVMYVVKSPTTAFVLSWSRSSTRGSIMVTSCLLGFLPIFNDVYSPYSTPQFV